MHSKKVKHGISVSYDQKPTLPCTRNSNTPKWKTTPTTLSKNDKARVKAPTWNMEERRPG